MRGGEEGKEEGGRRRKEPHFGLRKLPRYRLCFIHSRQPEGESGWFVAAGLSESSIFENNFSSPFNVPCGGRGER